MNLKDRIEEEYKQAFKAGKQEAVSCFRSLKAAIKNAEIDARHDFSDAETEKVVAGELKRTRESLEAFKHAGRAEQAAVLGMQCDLLMTYMPEQLSADALQKIITDAIQTAGATSPGDAGKVMGLLRF